MTRELRLWVGDGQHPNSSPQLETSTGTGLADADSTTQTWRHATKRAGCERARAPGPSPRPPIKVRRQRPAAGGPPSLSTCMVPSRVESDGSEDDESGRRISTAVRRPHTRTPL